MLKTSKINRPPESGFKSKRRACSKCTKLFDTTAVGGGCLCATVFWVRYPGR